MQKTHLEEKENLKLIHAREMTKNILEVTEKERERIAIELHDNIGQILSSAKFKIEAYIMKNSLKDELLKGSVDLMINAGKSLKDIVHNLIPMEIEQFGLVAAISSLVNDIQKTSGIKFNLITNFSKDQNDKKLEIFIYRIVQEALNNIIKHSKAKNAEISILCENDEIKISISDDGIGFDFENYKEHKANNKFGIMTIKQRAEILGGTIDYKSMPAKGTKIEITIPTRNFENAG
jgi:signal transduction histidine kinase